MTTTNQDEYSDFKIFHHPEKFDSFKKDIITAPVYVRVKPTNNCNHACFDCVYEPSFSGIHSAIDRSSSIPREKMLEILNDFRDMSVKAVTYSGGGEPLTYPDILEVLRTTLEFGIDLSIITNGQELRGEKAGLLTNAKWVRVSSNSCTSEIFQATRQRPSSWFSALESNLRNFARIKQPSCILGINFVVNDINHAQVYESARFYRNLGVNNIKFTPAWRPGFQEYHAPFKDSVIDQITRARQDFSSQNFRINDTYEKDFKTTGISQREYHHCFYMQITPAIGADQVVYFCHNKAYDPSGALGSIRDRSFKDLWFSEESQRIFKEFDPSKFCKHQCTNDRKNKIIIDTLKSGGDHVHFV